MGGGGMGGMISYLKRSQETYNKAERFGTFAFCQDDLVWG